MRDITTNPDDAAIALAIISMAHSMHMQVIAEGVETPRPDGVPAAPPLRRDPGLPLQPRAAGRANWARWWRQNRSAPDRTEPRRHRACQTLLLVDDDVNALAALHRLFRRDNYRILTAVSPAEGFELLALHQVQVIVCDQRMPVMSGTEFLSKVKEMYPDTMRIILSGDTGLQAVLDSINRGAIYRFYTKPWDDTQLRDNIRLAFHHYWLVNGARDDPRRSHVRDAGRGSRRLADQSPLKWSKPASARSSVPGAVDQAQARFRIDGAHPRDRRAGPCRPPPCTAARAGSRRGEAQLVIVAAGGAEAAPQLRRLARQHRAGRQRVDVQRGADLRRGQDVAEVAHQPIRNIDRRMRDAAARPAPCPAPRAATARACAAAACVRLAASSAQFFAVAGQRQAGVAQRARDPDVVARPGRRRAAARGRAPLRRRR